MSLIPPSTQDGHRVRPAKQGPPSQTAKPTSRARLSLASGFDLARPWCGTGGLHPILLGRVPKRLTSKIARRSQAQVSKSDSARNILKRVDSLDFIRL